MKKLNRKSVSPPTLLKGPAPAPYFHLLFNFSDSSRDNRNLLPPSFLKGRGGVWTMEPQPKLCHEPVVELTAHSDSHLHFTISLWSFFLKQKIWKLYLCSKMEISKTARVYAFKYITLLLLRVYFICFCHKPFKFISRN